MLVACCWMLDEGDRRSSIEQRVLSIRHSHIRYFVIGYLGISLVVLG